MGTVIADHWEMLTDADKGLIMEALKRHDPKRYNNIHLGVLGLVDLKLIRRIIYEYPRHVVYVHPNGHTSSRKRVRKHLSIELLMLKREREFREGNKRRRATRKAG